MRWEQGQNMRKYAQKMCAKYATLKIGLDWVGYPITHHPWTFATKYDDIFDQFLQKKKIVF